jgi:hypothetical protein
VEDLCGLASGFNGNAQRAEHHRDVQVARRLVDFLKRLEIVICSCEEDVGISAGDRS